MYNILNRNRFSCIIDISHGCIGFSHHKSMFLRHVKRNNISFEYHLTSIALGIILLSRVDKDVILKRPYNILCIYTSIKHLNLDHENIVDLDSHATITPGSKSVIAYTIQILIIAKTHI